jgi:uncharacterized membrane protein YGL010W
MKSLDEQVLAYAAYHRDPRNKLTHFVGVPLVTLSLFIVLSWLRFAEEPLPITAATPFYLTVFVYYLILDWRIALLQMIVTVPLVLLADGVARLPFHLSLTVFLAAFIGGWIIQLIGHGFEGRRPALADNLLQIFNAPLFLTVEVLIALGYRQELRKAIEAGEKGT